MKNAKRWAAVFFAVAFSLVAVLAFAQDTDPSLAVPSTGGEFVGLTFSAGLTMAIVQLLRRTGAVDKVPGFLRPLIAGAIGFGAIYVSNLLPGVTIDLSPIATLFAAGGGASLFFGMGKEIKIGGKPFLASSGGK